MSSRLQAALDRLINQIEVKSLRREDVTLAVVGEKIVNEVKIL